MKLTDAAILEVISECEPAKGRVRGTVVRRELLRRYGVRAGTDRLYRLIRTHESRAGQRELTALRARIAELELELANARDEVARERERAELAEYREQSHLNKWATELHTLREKVARYEGLAGVRTQAQLESKYLRLQIQLARQRQTIDLLTKLLHDHGITVPQLDE